MPTDQQTAALASIDAVRAAMSVAAGTLDEVEAAIATHMNVLKVA